MLFVYLSIGIKILFLLSIGICFHFGIKMLIEICFQCLIYFQLILTFLKFFICSLSIGIIMHYIDIFLIGIILVLISPLIDIIFVLDKKGENIIFLLFSLTLCWWLTKRGRSIWVLYACLFYVLLILVLKNINTSI